MAEQTPSFTLTILGATGYTGRLCVAEAVRQGISVRLAGRRAEALAALAAEHADAGVSLSTVVADVHDPAALAEVVNSSDVLLSTVGPYSAHGRPVVEAALAAATPYVDVTGEIEFISWVHGLAERAEQRAVALAPAMGYDGVPGELLGVLAAQALGRPVRTARVAYAVTGGKMSAGTARSAIGALQRGGTVWRNGRVSQEPAGIEQWQVPFPQPPGPTGAISVPFPEVASLGRSIGADVVRSYFVVPGAGIIPPLAGPAQRLTALLSTTPVWGLLERGVERLPEGPSARDRAAAKTVVLAEAAGGDGVAAIRWARVNDPYGTTAVIAVHAARRLASGAVKPGVLTPSQVFEPDALLGEIAEEVGPA